MPLANESFLKWQAVIRGPKDSIWEGEKFFFKHRNNLFNLMLSTFNKNSSVKFCKVSYGKFILKN